MVNPSVLSTNLVTLAKSNAPFVTAMGGSNSVITSYEDDFPAETSTLEAIAKLKSPGAMLMWRGTEPGNLSNREVFNHKFSFILRASNYFDAWEKFINGVPSSGDGQKMLMCSIHASCYPIGKASIGRQQLLIDQMSMTFLEYWEITFTLTEKGDY
jgi:hypothetical protein